MDWNPSLYDGSHSFVWKRAEDLIELLAPRAGERILDAGCGTGHLAARLAGSGAHVVGIDSSAAMVEQARTAFPAIEFHEVSLLDFETAEPFDAVFSNAVLHWVQPPELAAQRIFAALRPGGRFVAEFGGHGNVAGILQAATMAFAELELVPPASPWYFPTIGEYATLLEQTGFSVQMASLFDRPTPLDGGDSGFRTWMEMFGAPVLEPAPAAARAVLVERAAEFAAPQLKQKGVWNADYRRLRVVAFRPVGGGS